MSTLEKPGHPPAHDAAIRVRRERRSRVASEIAELEASLLADIEAFDLEAAERRAEREYMTRAGGSMADASLVFPELAAKSRAPAPVAQPPAQAKQASPPAEQPPVKPEKPAAGMEKPPVEAKPLPAEPPPAASEAPPAKASGGLLDQLRHQAELRQRELHSALAERSASNESIDQALKRVFFYLHEFVQQLNIVKAEIPRAYPLVEHYTLDGLAWQEGFADYRTQSQSAGALVELVSFSYRLTGRRPLHIERNGPSVERFRTTLFDFGLPFTCKEFKNERRYVERAEFDIRPDVSVSARWRADFDQGCILIETRNLERLGSGLFKLTPQSIDRTLLDAFGHLVLGQKSQFREMTKRGQTG